jgi:predicted anti-sigma-YlaC factor YlaD
MNLNCKWILWLPILALCLGSGCSVRKFAVNKLGNALAQGGSTFASDDDPELVKQAIPFSLKLIESLLAESPNHQGLLLAACQGFTQYGYAFVQEDADELENQNLTSSIALRERARRLYARATRYGLRGLEVRYPGFEKALRADAKTAVARLNRRDVPLIYWTSVSWAAGIALSKDRPETIADVLLVQALADRAETLDADYDHGSLESFLISFESARTDRTGNLDARIKKHFDRAMALSQNQLAGPLVSYAEAVSVKNQNVKEFQSLLHQALQINPDSKTEWRLMNLITQRRARWLLSRTDDLFLISDSPADNKEVK